MPGHAAENGNSQQLSQSLADAGAHMGAAGEAKKPSPAKNSSKPWRNESARRRRKWAAVRRWQGRKMAARKGNKEAANPATAKGKNPRRAVAKEASKEVPARKVTAHQAEARNRNRAWPAAARKAMAHDQQADRRNRAGTKRAGAGENTDNGSTNLAVAGGLGEHFHNGVVGKEGTFVRVYSPQSHRQQRR